MFICTEEHGSITAADVISENKQACFGRSEKDKNLQQCVPVGNSWEDKRNKYKFQLLMQTQDTTEG